MSAGRPSKKNRDRIEKILKAIEDGCTRKAAANSCGIAYNTLREWEKEFPEFSEALELAEGVAEAKHIAVLQQAAMGWEETSTTVTSDPEKGKTVSIKKVRRFAWQASALWLRTRRPQEHSPTRPITDNDDSSSSKLADELAGIAKAMLERSMQQDALDAEYRDVEA